MLEDFCMDKKKLTREEALRRWNASKELKRKCLRNSNVWFGKVAKDVMIMEP